MDNLSIRQAEPGDVPNLTVLKQQVWIATYATEGIRTEFSRYVLDEFTEENTRRQIEDERKLILIAEINEHLLGCIELAFNEVCPAGAVSGPEIAVLYVLERFCGKGIGKALLDQAVMKLKNAGYTNAWLTVYYKNENAIGFYKRQHFTEVGKTFFNLGENQYENKVMMLGIS
ncbi:MAG: N-acetyltransferase family protein [Lentimicrobium sp.]